jgi:hypothetical protein
MNTHTHTWSRSRSLEGSLGVGLAYPVRPVWCLPGLVVESLSSRLFWSRTRLTFLKVSICMQTHDRQERRSLHKQKFLRKGQTCNTFNDTGTSQSDYAVITVPLSRVRSLEGLHLACPVRGKEFLQRPDALLTEELQRLEKLERQTVASSSTDGLDL